VYRIEEGAINEDDEASRTMPRVTLLNRQC
jgi:hypothetical protein